MHWAAACSALALAAPEPPAPCPPFPWAAAALWLRLGTVGEAPPEPLQPAMSTTADAASAASAYLTTCLCTGFLLSFVLLWSWPLFYAPRHDTGLTGEGGHDLRLLGRCHAGCRRSFVMSLSPWLGHHGIVRVLVVED